MQWLEDNIAPQVVWEVLSPGNRPGEMQRKFAFYDRFGVEEYDSYSPETFSTLGWLRKGYGILQPIANMDGWVSPRLGIRFGVTPGESLRHYHANGEPFQTSEEITEDRDRERQHRMTAVQERDIGREERLAALQERDLERERRERADAERAAAEQERDPERELRTRADRERAASKSERDRPSTQLRALGIDPNSS